MGIENLTTANTPTPAPASKNSGDAISADTFRQMIDVLDNLASHSHIFYDDYNTVCECQCACQCGRGTV